MTDETKRIGDYQILDELGSGGMGRVWRARNVITDRIEAIKVLLPDLAGRQELAARFQREIKLMASLNHPNIAALRTAFTADNQLYMVMEYVEGTTVAQKLERGADTSTRCVELYPAGAGRRELRAQTECDSPRHQARQHDADPAGHDQVDGLWHRARRRGSQPDHDRHHHGIAELHVARAGKR